MFCTFGPKHFAQGKLRDNTWANSPLEIQDIGVKTPLNFTMVSALYRAPLSKKLVTSQKG